MQPNTKLRQQLELSVLQQRLIQWQLTLPDFWQDPVRRGSIGHEARRWSDQLLAIIGNVRFIGGAYCSHTAQTQCTESCRSCKRLKNEGAILWQY